MSAAKDKEDELREKIIKRNTFARDILQKLFEHSLVSPSMKKASNFISADISVEDLSEYRTLLKFMVSCGHIKVDSFDIHADWARFSPADVYVDIEAVTIKAMQDDMVYMRNQSWLNANYPTSMKF